MSSCIQIDKSNEDNFKLKEFKVIPKGKYMFEVANHPKIESAKSSDNNIVNVQLKCIDDAEDGAYRGVTVFDTLVLIPTCEWKLVHLALASGTQNKEEIQETGVDISLWHGAQLEAEIDVQPPRGEYKEKNVVSRYLFEPEDEE